MPRRIMVTTELTDFERRRVGNLDINALDLPCIG